jgi:tetratricopeptide (TPR) repeat protein
MAALRDRARAAEERNFATYIEVDRLILSGWIAQADGDAETAAERMREATRLEQTVQKHVVTPGALLPPYEALGDLLMAQQRPAEALEAYEQSLQIWPNRYNSLLGATRAARAAQDSQRERAYHERFVEVTGGAVPGR